MNHRKQIVYLHLPTTAELTTAQKRHTLNMASKVFIVTGASQGLGLAIAKYLIGESHQVIVTARSAEPLEDLKRAHPGQVDYVAGDMTDAEVIIFRSMEIVGLFEKGVGGRSTRFLQSYCVCVIGLWN